MLMPTWLIYGITGGLIGAILALVGFLLQKAGMQWGRYLVALTLVFTVPIADRVVGPALQQAMWTEAQTADQLRREIPQLLGTLQSDFPDEYRSLITSTTQVVRNTGGRDAAAIASGQIASLMTSMRQKYAPFLRFAGIAELRALAALSASFHRDVLARDGYEVCGRVAMEGALVLTRENRMAPHMSNVDAQSTALFRAARSGIDNPVAWPEPTDNDWAAAGNLMAQSGATDAEFAAMSAGDPADPNLCPAIAKLLDAMSSPALPSSGALLASFFSEASTQ